MMSAMSADAAGFYDDLADDYHLIFVDWDRTIAYQAGVLVPLLRRLAHLPEHQPRRVRLPLARRIISPTGRHQFYTVRIDNGRAVPAFKASGDNTSMSQADGYIEIPTHTDIVSEGDLVDVTLF